MDQSSVGYVTYRMQHHTLLYNALCSLLKDDKLHGVIATIVNSLWLNSKHFCRNLDCLMQFPGLVKVLHQRQANALPKGWLLAAQKFIGHN